MRHESGKQWMRREPWIIWIVVAGSCPIGLFGCAADRDDTDDPIATSALTASADGGNDSGGQTRLDVGGGGTDSSNPDTGAGCDEDVDIVFVMDVSTSMGPFLSTLAQEIVAVDQAIQALDLPGAPRYGLAVFVDDAVMLNMGGPYADVQALQADFNMWSAFTASNEQVGGGNSNLTFPENSLDALWFAATGFQWRATNTTSRIIIHTTDDTFWDGPTTGNGVSILHGYDETVSELQAAQIRVFTFADQIGGSCECDDVTPGWSTPYQGKDPIPQATDGAVFDIDLVLTGQVSLSDALPSAVEGVMCVPYPPQG